MSDARPPAGDHVSASVFVDAPPDVAFEVFTAQIDQWWRHGLRYRGGARAAGTQVTLVHSGFASLPSDHPVRHGEPVDAFIRRTAMGWSEQMSSFRETCTAASGAARWRVTRGPRDRAREHAL